MATVSLPYVLTVGASTVAPPSSQMTAIASSTSPIGTLIASVAKLLTCRLIMQCSKMKKSQDFRSGSVKETKDSSYNQIASSQNIAWTDASLRLRYLSLSWTYPCTHTSSNWRSWLAHTFTNAHARGILLIAVQYESWEALHARSWSNAFLAVCYVTVYTLILRIAEISWAHACWG